MRKTIIPFIAIIFFITACTNSDAPAARTEVKQYTAEQLFNNKAINGAAFNADETKILAGANTSGIFNLYELNIADTSMKALTSSKKESFFAIDYLPGS